MHYSSGEAKPKISFPFFVGSPHTPRRGKEEREEKFLVFAPATAGRGRGGLISPRSDCFGKKFGFCSGDTAIRLTSFAHGYNQSRMAVSSEQNPNFFPKQSVRGPLRAPS